MAAIPGKILVCAVLLAGLAVRPVLAAGPRAIMFFGGSLQRPVFLTNWEENITIMGGSYEATPEELRNRPFLNVVMFSNAQWAAITADGRRAAADIRVEEVTPNARFYPAKGDSPALIVTSTKGWTLTQEGIEALTRSGVPVIDKSR